MSWVYDPSSWVAGHVPVVADFQAIATDLHVNGGNVDGAGYGYSNSGFLVLLPGALPGTTYTVTATSWAGGIATLTIGAHAILVRQRISVSSVVPAGYNSGSDSVVVTAITGTTISYALTSNPGTYTSGGTVAVGPTPANGMLAVDQNGHLVIWNGSAWTGSGQAMSRAHRNTDQSIANASNVALTFDVNEFDTGRVHNTVTNNSRFTVPTGQDGTYVIVGQVDLGSATPGLTEFDIRLNGSASIAILRFTPTSGSVAVLQVNCIYSFVAGDYIEFIIMQNSGGSISAVSPYTWGSICKVA